MTPRDELAALLHENAHDWATALNCGTARARWLNEHGPAVLALIDAAEGVTFAVWEGDEDEKLAAGAFRAALARLTGGHDDA